jgi:hypothetical protein
MQRSAHRRPVNHDKEDDLRDDAFFKELREEAIAKIKAEGEAEGRVEGEAKSLAKSKIISRIQLAQQLLRREVAPTEALWAQRSKNWALWRTISRASFRSPYELNAESAVAQSQVPAGSEKAAGAISSSGPQLAP